MKKLFFNLGFYLFCTSAVFAQGRAAEDYRKITSNGVWCWFSDPRIIFHQNNYYGGYVDSAGNILSFAYDTKTGTTQTFQQFDKIDKDDHANPSMIKLQDGRLATFFSGHGGIKNTPIYYRISKSKDRPMDWGQLQSISPKVQGNMGNTYTNPIPLAKEGNRVYLFFRGANFKPNMVFSDDMNNWSEAVALIKDKTSEDKYNSVRPYTKIASNYENQIHFAFTDGHPRNEYLNSIYYLSYKDGKYQTASGKILGDHNDLPFSPNECDIVYDAKDSKMRAWIWDIAYDKNNAPVLVYARFISELKHEYWYAKWDGSKWINKKITDGGSWFPRRYLPKERAEGEPHYSGGVVLDHQNPNIVYLSRPINDVFEIEKWTLSDDAKQWNTEAITSKSTKDNVRPYVALQDPKSKVFWMYNYHYPNFRDYHTAIRVADVAPAPSIQLNRNTVLGYMKSVADWQINNLDERRNKGLRIYEQDWINGALYQGLFKWAELSQEAKYTDWLRKIGNRNYWQVGNRMFHADDICVSMTYLDLYSKYQQKNMLIPTQARVDWVIDQLKNEPNTIEGEKAKHKDRWTWCDALFMAPPVYAKLSAITADDKYLAFMDKEFKACYELLYDKQEKLFFRDVSYIDKKEANGQKMFWGRGNGWVLGGLVSILETMPDNDSRKKFYQDLFVEMCVKIASLQSANGYWSASMLDPQSYPAPETSSTGFITYALAYGINSKLLDRNQYLPTVQKGWQALCAAVNTEGKLGYVQPVGENPKNVTKDMTELYGPGAFLLAGSEVIKLSK